VALGNIYKAFTKYRLFSRETRPTQIFGIFGRHKHKESRAQKSAAMEAWDNRRATLDPAAVSRLVL